MEENNMFQKYCLTISQYEAEEQKNKSNLSNRFLRCFAPLTFQKGGFPTEIHDENELVRYIDSQHSEMLEYYFENICEGLSVQEFNIVKKITKEIYHFTFNNFKTEFLVKAPVIDAVYILRLIRSITNNKKIRIMEIGAGSGVLGGILLLEGYKYCCIDVTQAFYILQSRMLPQMAESVDELVFDDYNDSQFVHMPYWKVWDYRNKVVKTDICVCNHTILEISLNALKFYIKMTKKWMENSPYRFFVIRSWGWSSQQKKEDVIEEFHSAGFMLVYLDHEKDVAIFHLPDVLIFGEKFKRLHEKSNKIRSAIGAGEKIQLELEKVKRTVFYDELCRMYTSITDKQESPDEIFSEYINSN